MSPLFAALVVALSIHDQTPMLASPDAKAAKQTLLWPGDWLEVRGQRKDYLRVYHHRNERPGYVHVSHVRTYDTASPTVAAELRAVIDFLRDAPGSESLGIGAVALYLKVAPPGLIDSHIFDALGTMADRLAARASTTRTTRDQSFVSAHLDVAASYGLRFQSFEEGERTRLCYDGDAFRRVLTFRAQADEVARAVLGLTAPICLRPSLRPAESRALLSWFVTLLDKADPTAVAPYVGNRLRIRRAVVGSMLAFELARGGQADDAARASQRALDAYARVDRAQLSEADAMAIERAAVHVATARWSRELARSSAAEKRVRVKFAPRAAGETCVQIEDRGAKKATASPASTAAAAPVAERCTFGLVWPASLRVAPNGKHFALTVQHLPGWVELWVFHKTEEGWSSDTLVPAMADPTLGYVEVAGFSPGSDRLFVVREAFVERQLQRRFQVLRTPTLAVVKEAPTLRKAAMSEFKRWQSPEWKGATLALR
jgi:hypothetical protein